MRVRVLLFARARDLAGAASASLELPERATVAALRRALAEAYPRLGGFLPLCAAAVGGDVASDEATLAEGAEVAILPPVSGGDVCRGLPSGSEVPGSRCSTSPPHPLRA